MWRPWGKSTARIHSASSSPSFSCSSFKDIQSLCLEEPQQTQQNQQLPSPNPTRKPSVFHRVRLANSLLRTWSTHLPPQPQPPILPRTLSYPEQTEPEPEPVVSKPEPEPIVSKLQPESIVFKPEPEPIVSKLQPESIVFKPEPGPEHHDEVSKPEPQPQQQQQQPAIHFPGTEQRVVVYYTSLRVVRPTFEGCKSVLSILHGFRVQIDERDVSMDAGFITELNRIMGRAGSFKDPGLPRVFIAGRYIGGAEEVRQLNEIGELKKLLLDLPAADPSDCHVCAGHRFVLCDECNGSRKIYTQKTGFKTCNACNENGLLRCPSCLASAPTFSS